MKGISGRHNTICNETAGDEVRARRDFLKKCGKYAVVVPPAMALLLTRDANAGEICIGSLCIDGPTGPSGPTGPTFP